MKCKRTLCECEGGQDLEFAFSSRRLLSYWPAFFLIIVAIPPLLVAQVGPSVSLSPRLDPASASSTLLWSNQNPSDPGTAITFSAEVAPGYAPTPTGAVAFQDGNTEIGNSDVDPVTNTNLLLFSSQFDNTVWTASDQNSVLTSNYSSTPIGDQTAYRYQNIASGSGTYISQEISGLSGSQPVTFSIWLRSNTGSAQSINISIIDNSYNESDENCLVTSTWQRCWVTMPPGAASVQLFVGSYYTPWQWDVSIWGAQLEGSSSAGPYVPTTSTSTTATLALATFTAAELANGAHSITAAYSGDTNYAPSTSIPLTQTVGTTPDISLSSSQDPSILGDDVVFSATVSDGATGHVTFTDNVDGVLGTVVLVSGVASAEHEFLNPGQHFVTASYEGDVNHAPTISWPWEQDVVTTPILSASPNPAIAGGQVTLTVKMPVDATGRMTFIDGGGDLGSSGLAVVNGSNGPYITAATYPMLSLALGHHLLTAVYSGDDKYDAGTSNEVDLNVAEAVQVRTSTLPSGTVGYPYAATLTAGGGVSPYGWSITQGSLPPGLVLDTNTGAISGTPTAASLSTFTAQVTDADSETSTAALSIQICDGLTITTDSSLPNGTVGVAYQQILSACGSYGYGFSWNIDQYSTLPPGLNDESTGAIAGIPTAAGTSQFEVWVHSDFLSMPKVFSLTIQPPGAATGNLLWSNPNPSSAGDPITFTAEVFGGGSTPSGTVTFQDGGIPIGSADLTPTTNTNFLPFSSFCGTQWGPDYNGYYGGTTITPNYSTSPLGDQTACRLQSFGDYNAWAAAPDASGLGGAQPATFSIWLKSNTDGLQSVPISLIDLDTYVHTDKSCLVTTEWRRCSVTTPTNANSVLPTIGEAYQTFSPWDISIWGAQVEASNSAGAYVSTADRAATATVATATLTTASLASGAHSAAASYSGDSNHDPSTSTPLTHKVDQVKITNSYPLVNARVGTPYSALLNAVGGSPPYIWTVALGALPNGLILGTDGTISGTPTWGTGSIFTAQVADSSNPPDTVNKEFEIDLVNQQGCLPSIMRRRDSCGSPPSISGVYANEASAGATGQSITVYGCYNTDENGNVGTLTINLPSGFTGVSQPVIGDDYLSVQQNVNIASDAQLGTNQISVHQSLDGCEWNTNELPYYVTPADQYQAVITGADITIDSITIDLEPAGHSGNLRIQLTGPSGNYTVYNSTATGGGPHAYSFAMTQSAPRYEFTNVTAEWTVDGTTIPARYPYHIRNLGKTHQTGYNSPMESVCGGQPQPDTLFDSKCHLTNGNLLSSFIDQLTNINYGTGSGHSTNYGDVGQEFLCAGRSATSLRTHVTIKGALGSLDDDTVAVCHTGRDYVRGAKLFVIGVGLKTVTDRCPKCCDDPPHIDQYATVTDCPWPGPTPTQAVTVRIY